MAQGNSKIKLTLLKSKYGRKPDQVACLQGLGLRRPHHSVVVDATPENQGMIRKVAFLLRVEEV